jgi:hypothetical protein
MKYFFNVLLFILFIGISCIKAFAQSDYNNAYLSHEIIKQEGRNIQFLDAGAPTDLPIGIVKEIAGQEYIISIDSIVLTPGGSYMSASAIVDVPATDDKLAFTGNKIIITPAGIKGASSGKLHLANDIPIRLNNNVKLTLKGTEQKTYVEFDCNGFQGMGVQGEFEFCRNFLIPELPDGSEAPEPARVKARFETQMSDFGNMMAKVSFTPFQVPNLKGFGFYVQDAWVDQSDIFNPSGLIFPEEYQSPYFEDGNLNMWQGFFLRQISVKLPSQFNSGTSNVRKEVLASNVLIDNMGFSGKLTGRNLIPFDEGSMSGWAFSMDEIMVVVKANKLAGAGFKGFINMPISKEDKKLAYTAIIEAGNNYYFNIASTQNLEVPLWGATMNLYPTSSIDVILKDKKFIPGATLHGDISLKPDLGNGGDKGEFRGIVFENLRLSASKPHIVPGSFSIVSKNSQMAGFAFTINNIGIVSREEQVGLKLDLSLHLMKDSEGGFSGQTGITIWGKYEENSVGRQKWKYENIELDRVRIDVRGGAYEIRGELNIYRKDPIYGNGFRGMVAAKFQPGLAVTATAQFGNINGMRYWYVDALAQMSGGVPIAPGFGLYGFGGGLYHHMKKKEVSVNLDAAPSATTIANTEGVTTIQAPPSGMVYLPDESIFLGLKATVIVGTHSGSEAFNADATFEIAFNKNSGVNSIGFYGSGYFMTKIEDRKADVPIKADVNISMDFVNEVLHGNFDIYINVAGAVRGIHPGNLAGGAVLHFEKSEWYIHIGTPSTRLGVNFVNLFQASAYFMVGTNIPGMPPPPKRVSDILGGINLDFMRDENALGKGNGFCFGASLDVNTGRQQVLMFYGQFAAGAGFDIMLKNYGNDVKCAGRSSALGLKGWYASGQAYAYVQGEIGIKVDLVFASGEFKILEIGAAAVFQAKLPNPTWMEGNVGGYYSILNDKIKGNCRFSVTIGEQCQMVGGSVLSGIKVIAEVSPRTGENDVNVFNNPQAVFSLPIEKSFELEDMDGQVKAFRVKLAHFELKHGSSLIAGNLEWNEYNDVVAFNSSDILPGTATVSASVKVFFEELQNGAWKPVIVGGKVIEEILEVSFNTGEAPDYIPLSNVKYSYPHLNQCNLYKDEYNKGYIQLNKGQDELFEHDYSWLRKGRFLEAGETSGGIVTDIHYDTQGNTVSFNIPSRLHKNKIYALELVNIPATNAGAIDANISSVKQNLSGVDDGSVTMETKTIEGNRDVLEEKVFFGTNFRTSMYATFAEKIKAFDISEGWSRPILDYNGIHELGLNMAGEEGFDKFELLGTANSEKLINLEAALNNNWYSKRVYPLIYKEYPLNGSLSISWRGAEQLGLPPVRAVDILQSPDNRELNENDVAGKFMNKIAPYSNIIYRLPFYTYKDFVDLQLKAIYLMVSNSNVSQYVKDIVYQPYPGIISGDYEVELKYTLPGINKVTSNYKLTIKNH